MARNLRQYLVDENTPVSPEWVRRVFGDIDARIDALEQIKADWQAAVDVLTSQALLRIDEALRPAFDELQQLASVGAFFTTTSASDVAVGTGLKTLIVDEPRKNFVPAEYVVVSSAGAADIGMAGRLVSYDPEIGELVVNVELASGTGSRNDWRISVGTPPDLTHAGRTDNPHGVTPAQIGAAVEGHGHQIGDVTGLQGALDAKAASVHGHQIADVSGLQTALDGKLDNTVAAFADRIDTLNENTAPSGAEFVPCSDGQKVALSMLLGGSLVTGSGYVKTSDGLIIQHVSAAASGSSQTLVLPIAFPNACIGAIASGGGMWTENVYNYYSQTTTTYYRTGWIKDVSWTNADVTVSRGYNPPANTTVHVIAFGY